MRRKNRKKGCRGGGGVGENRETGRKVQIFGCKMNKSDNTTNVKHSDYR